jgi:hypothetical protein
MEQQLYTYEEISQLKDFITNLGLNLPEDRLTYVWENYKRITGSNENQPCSCQSSAGLWVKAVTAIRTYVQENS